MKHIETSVLVLQCDREMETREIKSNVGRRTYFDSVAGHLSKYIKSCYPDPALPMKKLLKETKYLADVTWVRNLCSDGKLDLAIERAERNIMSAIESDSLDEHSYSFVYKVFKQ